MICYKQKIMKYLVILSTLLIFSCGHKIDRFLNKNLKDSVIVKYDTIKAIKTINRTYSSHDSLNKN